MAALQSPDDVLESLVGRIADEFTRRHQRGEGPRLEEYTGRYPELAELLREILPAIQALSPAHGEAIAETPGPSAMTGGSNTVPTLANVVDYEILGEIGRGGMGVVYKARHRTLGRVVALKILRSSDAADLTRFRSEAQAVARLQHPNVVQIFEVQEADGQPFLALEYVEGGSLAERIKGEPQPPREAAALIETLSRAMAVAHDRGLVHRDLKPANILLSNPVAANNQSQPTEPTPLTTHRSPLTCYIPKISDFGLAKRLDLDLGQTQIGAIVGTPSYMAPEQAMGSGRVGPAADIFALGAILYELIAGRPPFKGPSVLETLELVRHAEPTPPSQLQPGCPRDLETICLKCLHKEPARRYASAAVLADDLQRFLKREAILARPVGTIERVGKWLRRHPALSASLGLGTFAALAVVALAVRLPYSWELEDANQKLGEAVGEKESALVASQDARLKLDDALERERALHYVHSIGLAQREWQANRIDEARRILDACPVDLRHWEWRYLYRQCHAEQMTIRGHIGRILALAVSPNGKTVAAISWESRLATSVRDLKIWDAATGKLVRELVVDDNLLHDVTFSPDGATLACASFSGTIQLRDAQDGRELKKFTSASRLVRVAFSPDGALLAAAAGPQIQIFEVASGNKLFALAGHTGAVQAIGFSADGARLVSGGSDRLVKLWDLKTRKEIFSGRGHTGTINDVAFSPNQDQIVSCGGGGKVGTVRGEVHVWNALDGKRIPINIALPARVSAAAFTADATHLVCAVGDGSILVLNVKTGNKSFTLRGHTGAVSHLVFTPDRNRIVTGSADGTIRVWSVQNPEFIERSEPGVLKIAFATDGSRLGWSRSPSGKTPVRMTGAPPTVDSSGFKANGPVTALRFAPDGRWIAVSYLDAVRLWDLDKVALRRTITEPGVVDLCTSADGELLATATDNSAVELRPDLGKRFEREAEIRPPYITAIKIWRSADGQLLRVLPGQITVAFSPDGQRLAGGDDRSVKVWDVATGKALCTLSGPDDPVLKVQFVAGGRQIVGFTHRQATLWEVDTGRIVANVHGLKGPACATPDGRRIVSLHSGVVKWWDTRLGRELLFLAVPDEIQLSHLALSADGHHLAASGSDKLIQWQAPPP